MNLCKFIVDREVTCKSTCLGKKEEGKIRPSKVVLPDAVVKNSFMKNLNKLKNHPDQFKTLGIKNDMTVDEENNERLLQDIANEKNTSSKEDSKRLRFCERCLLWDKKVVKLKRKTNQNSLPAKTSN